MRQVKRLPQGQFLYSEIRGLNVKVLTIPSGKDPDEFIKSKGNDGPAAFKALLDKCGNDVEYRLQKLKNAHNIS